MIRPYTGTKDGVAKGKRPGTEKLIELLGKRYGLKNLGTWVVRDIRDRPGILSVHASARAMDASYGTDRKNGAYVASWLAKNADALGIEAIHDYQAKPPRAWRCDRAKWKNTDDLGPGGSWLHIEISPAMADNAGLVESTFRKLPK